MQIIMKSMSLVNFKGIRQQNFKFSPFVNIISGDNAVGKTTILDAFLWCLFGKDSHDRKDFEIKTLDSTGQVIERIDHEVTLVLDVDGKNIEIKRAFLEKWTKKRGSEDSEFTGNETEYYWNDVPVKMSDFNSRIAGIIDENLFRLLTNVTYFHSLHWEKRREILFGLAGQINEKEILDGFTNKDQALIISNILNSEKTIADAKAEYAAKKKRIKDAIKDIPARIDESERSKPDPVDVNSLQAFISEKESEKDAIRKEIDELDDQAADQSKKLEAINQEYNAKVKVVYDLKRKYESRTAEITHQIQSEHKDPSIKINEIKGKLSEVNALIEKTEKRIYSIEQSIEGYKKGADELREQWFDENKKELSFDDQHFDCPTCKRELSKEDVELKKRELTANFNNVKARKLSEIKSRGLEYKEKIEDSISLKNDLQGERDGYLKSSVELRDSLFNLETSMSGLESIDITIKSAIENDAELKSLASKIEAAEVESLAFEKRDDTAFKSEIQAKKTDCRTRINAIDIALTELKVKIGSADAISKINDRIAELKQQESTMSHELSLLEGMEFAILQYEKARVQFIEDKVNHKFQYVGFRMFETQINGSEIPVCKTLIDGVPFDAANNAARINAGLDIINALSSHNGVYAPIFIDNAESVNELIPVASQLIRLEVSHDPELVFVTEDELESVTN